jgi:hypothetical protein
MLDPKDDRDVPKTTMPRLTDHLSSGSEQYPARIMVMMGIKSCLPATAAIRNPGMGE